MAKWVTPMSASFESHSATSAASGVVSPGGVSCSCAPSGRETVIPRVPMLAEVRPALANTWRQKLATEVLPFVPVMATQVCGWRPQKLAAASA